MPRSPTWSPKSEASSRNAAKPRRFGLDAALAVLAKKAQILAENRRFAIAPDSRPMFFHWHQFAHANLVSRKEPRADPIDEFMRSSMYHSRFLRSRGRFPRGPAFWAGVAS